MHQITRNVYRISFWGGFLNVYVVDTGSGLVLVDTGLSASHIDQLGKALAQAGRSFSDVKHILITHAHVDHVGGLPALQRQTDARTHAHRREALVIRGEQQPVYANRRNLSGMAWLTSLFVVPYTVEPARVDVMVVDGDVLDDVIPGVEVVELIGHSLGQVGYWWPERRLLFGGDVMMNVISWGLRMPFKAVSPDWEAAKRSIKRAAELDVAILCLGHGAPIIGGAAEKIRAFADGLTLRV
jgi:glyoxylase-like metal-dependent hydrolase (beta-lactamase superfamily II)